MGEFRDSRENVHRQPTPVFRNVSYLPGWDHLQVNYPDKKTDEPTFWQRRGIDLGLLETMAPSTKPPELRLNYSTALFYLAVISAILGGFWFMHDRIASVNYERGREAERRVQQELEMQKLEKKLFVVEEKLKAAGEQ